jgi:hypothetical protein
MDLAFVLDAKYMPNQTGPDGVDLQAAYWTARIRIYIDGKLQGERESKIFQGDLSQIGAFQGDPKTFNGVIEEVKVFPVALSPEQIQKFYVNPSSLKEKTVLWMNF